MCVVVIVCYISVDFFETRCSTWSHKFIRNNYVVFLFALTVDRMCCYRWTRLTGEPPVVEHTQLNVREFMLNPVGQKVS